MNALIAMPWEKRASALLEVAGRANETIRASHPQSFKACEQALAACKDWLDGKPVTPESLATYLDADGRGNPWMQEAVFNGDPSGLNALIFITMVIGHIAYISYVNHEKSMYMSEVISEAGSNIFKSIAEYGTPYGISEFNFDCGSI